MENGGLERHSVAALEAHISLRHDNIETVNRKKIFARVGKFASVARL